MLHWIVSNKPGNLSGIDLIIAVCYYRSAVASHIPHSQLVDVASELIALANHARLTVQLKDSTHIQVIARCCRQLLLSKSLHRLSVKV